MATYDYFKASWKNGPGVVSDAPTWVLDAIDRELPVWMGAHERELVGVHVCVQSNLVLGILVSPWAFGGDGSLKNSTNGSFIHVFATDHPDRATLRVDEVRQLFESTYGTPISDGAARQQRNFMLLDFPYHRELAKDLFIDKDRVERSLDLGASLPSSAFEETLAGLVTPHAPHEEPESHPAPPGSLSSLLSHRDPKVPSRGRDGLPFDQGLSYAEVIAGLKERLYANSSPVEAEHTLGDPPAPERPAVSPSSRVDGLRSPEAPPEVDVSATAAGNDPLALDPLVVQSALVVSSPVVDALPLDLLAPAMRVQSDVTAAAADVGAADEEETEEEFELRSSEPISALGRGASLLPRRGWSPIYTVAGLLLAGLLIGGVIVPRLWERAPEDASLAEREVPAAVIPDAFTRVPGHELAGLDRRTEADVSTEIDAIDIDAPELQPKAVPPAINVASLEVATEEVKPDLPSIEPVMAPVIDEAEADFPALAALKTKSAPEAVVRGAASRLEPAQSSVALEPAPTMAQVEVVTEPEPATEEETSSATADPAPAFDVAVADTLSEPSSEILEESAATRLGETPATNSTAAEAEVTATTIERETKPREGRRRRERKRLMGQINRYR